MCFEKTITLNSQYRIWQLNFNSSKSDLSLTFLEPLHIEKVEGAATMFFLLLILCTRIFTAVVNIMYISSHLMTL